MKNSLEFDTFNATMDKILKADPAMIRAEMEDEKQERAAKRKAKTEPSARASSDPED